MKFSEQINKANLNDPNEINQLMISLGQQSIALGVQVANNIAIGVDGNQQFEGENNNSLVNRTEAIRVRASQNIVEFENLSSTNENNININNEDRRKIEDINNASFFSIFTTLPSLQQMQRLAFGFSIITIGFSIGYYLQSRNLLNFLPNLLPFSNSSPVTNNSTVTNFHFHGRPNIFGTLNGIIQLLSTFVNKN